MHQIQALRSALAPLRERLLNHEIYHRLRTLDDLRTFMRFHVFAVWDFMSLLKALQRELTCVRVPWVPRGHRRLRRLINEIVLAEESDVGVDGAFISHFEMYHHAMRECGADTAAIDDLIYGVCSGAELSEALSRPEIPVPARVFVANTWRTIDSGDLTAVASAFTFGREDLIPCMFRRLLADLVREFPDQLRTYQRYLQRHIGLDDDQHGPLALEMINVLCHDSPQQWRIAEESAMRSLESRLKLWDGVLEALHAQPTLTAL